MGGYAYNLSIWEKKNHCKSETSLSKTLSKKTKHKTKPKKNQTSFPVISMRFQKAVKLDAGFQITINLEGSSRLTWGFVFKDKLCAPPEFMMNLFFTTVAHGCSSLLQ